jgi:hypothetical protein
MYRFMALTVGLLICGSGWSQTLTGSSDSGLSSPSRIDPFNYVIGTQTFSPAYQFTTKPSLLETAEAIHEMGATVIKFEVSRRYARRYGVSAGQIPPIHSLTELVRNEPAYRKVLDMPFAYYVLWTHTFSSRGDKSWREGFPKEAQDKEYQEMYEFVIYLLKSYGGSGKTFYLGHWEGDGWLRGSVRPEDDVNVTPQAVQGMIDWLNTRQRAVDDAKRDTPHSGVQVWHYTEVNHVKVAMHGHKALVNEVLPKTTVDYVSYSSYDTAGDPQELKSALDFIESKLPAKPGIVGKRVWLGEYGFPAMKYSPAEQDALSRRVMRVGLLWGCPFVLYWEIYNNEVDKNGKQKGFWLIDDKGVKQPLYYTHQKFYQWARKRATAFTKAEGRAPTTDEYRKSAVAYLDGSGTPAEQR